MLNLLMLTGHAYGTLSARAKQADFRSVRAFYFIHSRDRSKFVRRIQHNSFGLIFIETKCIYVTNPDPRFALVTET